jgi:hypothetical protein
VRGIRRKVRRKATAAARCGETPAAAKVSQSAAKAPAAAKGEFSPRVAAEFPAAKLRACGRTCLFVHIQTTDCGPRRGPLPGRAWDGRSADIYSHVYHSIFIGPGEVVYWSIFRFGARSSPRAPSPHARRCRHRGGVTMPARRGLGVFFRNNRGAAVLPCMILSRALWAPSPRFFQVSSLLLQSAKYAIGCVKIL